MAAGRQKKAFLQSKESDVLPHSYICKGKLETHVKAIHVMRIKTWKKIDFFVFHTIQSNVRSSTQDMGEGSMKILKECKECALDF